jgi:nucleotide-binding universal stress UspA family protein
MYTHLLVPLDGSAAAEAALPHAQAMAEKFQAKVTLVRVTVAAETVIAETATGAPGGPGGGPLIDPTPVVEAEQQEAIGYLQRVTERLRGAGLGEVYAEEPEGPAADSIVERARALGVDLIVMSTHARGGLGRLVFGSTADAVLRHTPCPVLLVRVDEHEAS